VKVQKGKFSYSRWCNFGEDFSMRKARLYLKYFDKGRGSLRKEFLNSKRSKIWSKWQGGPPLISEDSKMIGIQII